MVDPFAQIFARAAELGLQLSTLCQQDDGRFRAKWRRDHANADGSSAFAAACEDRSPYHALVNALAVAEKTIAAPAVEPDEDSLFGQGPVQDTDLFGGLL